MNYLQRKALELFKKTSVKVDIYQTLPSAWIIEDIDTYYHRVGLGRGWADRTKLVRPLMIILANVVTCLRSITVIAFPVDLTKEQEALFHYLGDISTVINLRYHFSFLLITYTVITLWLFIYHNHLTKTEGVESDIQRLKIAPIELLAGRKRPVDVGLTDAVALETLSKRAKRIVHFCYVIRTSMQITVPIGYYHLFMYQYFRKFRGDRLALVTPLVHVPLYFYHCDSVVSFLVTSIIYFYISAEYLRLKMLHLADKLARLSALSAQRMKMFRLFKVMREMRQVYCVFKEIQDYNTFWSKFNLVVISMITVNLSFYFFVYFFIDIHWMVGMQNFSVIILEVLFVSTILIFASYVDTLRKRVFRQMYSLRAYFGRHDYTRRQAKLLRIFSNKTLLWIETFTDTRLGFTLGPFFPINYQVFINVIIFVVTALLKLLQIQYDVD